MTRLIDADTLKATVMSKTDGMEDLWDTAGVLNMINNAPTVEYPFYQEAYQTGYEEGYENCTKDVIHSIAKQYSEHNELVPSWLHISNMREADDEL